MQSTVELEQSMRAQRSAALVVNTRSRRGERLLLQAKDELARRGVSVGPVFPVRNTAHLPNRVREAIALGHTLVIIGGGDGTISSAVGAFAYQDIVLGLLPLGTGNSFARSLNIPRDLPGAVEVIVTGRIAKVDLGKVDDLYFSNSISIGISTDVSRTTPNLLKRFLGEAAYVLVGLGVLARHQPFTFRYRTDSTDQTIQTHQVIIENGRFYGDTPVAGDKALEDRRLIVLTMEALDRWQLLCVWGQMILKMPTFLARMQRFTARQLWVETEPTKYVDIDGEVNGRKAHHIAVAPRALNVLVPRHAVGQAMPRAA